MSTYEKFKANSSDETLAQQIGTKTVSLLNGFEDITVSAKHFSTLSSSVWLHFSGKNFSLSITLDFEDHTIEIGEFFCRYDKSIVFLKLICALVRFGKIYDFRKIIARAKGNFTRVDVCGLYYLCAVAGFLPEINSALLINDHLNGSDFEDYNIAEFFRSDSGLNYWRMSGFEWRAEFYIAENSENIALLIQELTNWNLSHQLE